MAENVYQFNAMTEDGQQYTLGDYAGRPMVIVNTATKCGFAPQFEALEAIYQAYQAQGLIVLGFPSNQFKQELSSAEDAAAACRLTYGVTFPMHQLIAVNGKQTDPLFIYLKDHAKNALGTRIKWNFTKFLVNREGEVVKRFSPATKPEAMIPDIEKMLV
ncbi:glutathione peroxidase [Leuconostoc holzapfelii]|uniref:Glutathione peroxidase n=1 Tax=Leuconostoc holzapfelii TaxID=434464 RepID=A0A846ZCY4_9LACO|nr:glutathione peroxidase [Leuconostoc holzapfelii]NKZ18788.1 glutathione peroxidase [Leuconostoc holzapfelii]